MDSRDKIVGRASLPCRRNGVTVAKGWFDLLTADLCALLARARSGAQQLVVLVYGDESGRPTALKAQGRAQMVAALGCVDLVCVCPRQDADEIASATGVAEALDADAAQPKNIVLQILETLEA